MTEKTLRERVKTLSDTKDDRMRNMSARAMRVADAAYMTFVEHLTGLFTDDETGVDVEALGGVRVATMFYAELLQLMAAHSKAEIEEVLFAETLEDDDD